MSVLPQLLQCHGIIVLWARFLSAQALGYLKLRQIFRKKGRDKKKELLDQCLESIVQVESNADRHTLYAAIRRLAPKTLRQAAETTGDSGQLLTGKEEIEAYVNYCGSLLAPSQRRSPDTPPANGSMGPLALQKLRVASIRAALRWAAVSAPLSLILVLVGNRSAHSSG